MTTHTPRPEATSVATQDGTAGVEPLFLVVVGDGVFATSALPTQGNAVIGRAADSDDTPFVTRAEARGARWVVSY